MAGVGQALRHVLAKLRTLAVRRKPWGGEGPEQPAPRGWPRRALDRAPVAPCPLSPPPSRVPQGTLQDHTVLQDRLRRILGDLTFAEAYQRSGGCCCAGAGWVGC